MGVNPSKSFLSDRQYDALKWIAQIFLPALGAFYFSLGDLWNLPQVNKVVGTITIVDVFLGLLLKKSSDNYDKSDEKFDGTVEVGKTEGETTVSLDAAIVPEELEKKDEVVLRVSKEEPSIELEVKPAPKKRAPRKKA